MGKVGDLHTRRTFAESLTELKEIFRKWGIKDYVLPTRRGAANIVTIECAIQDRWITLSCDKFKWGQDAPERNLRALVMALDAARLADQRGIGDLFAKVAAEMLALPGPANGTNKQAMDRTAYDVLGVSRTASRGVLLAAYRARVHETHPDTTTGKAEAFRELQEAAHSLGIVDAQGKTII